ncbi:hypothetical protein [Streptomyces sp. NPDC005244]|uniref:hypothetical protein n=1 Tax=Streptomyces sp. NPDC005244 TaxID=3364708 RepID=UPI0036CDE044
MPVNTELLRKVRETIRRHPEKHDQGNWGLKTECGTTHCIAGWAAFLSGAVIDWERELDGAWSADTVNGGARSIEDYARDALGLTFDQSNIFYMGRDDALRRLDRLIEQ